MALTSNPEKLVIRPPESGAEWASVKEMLLAYRREFDDDTCFTSFEAEMDHIEDLYRGPDAQKLIAVDTATGFVAGCVAFRTFAPGIAEMKRLYVRPEYRKMALGRQLAEAIMERAAGAGYTTMYLDTMVRMDAAINLYSSLGFEIIPPYHSQDQQKVVCFERKLIQTS